MVFTGDLPNPNDNNGDDEEESSSEHEEDSNTNNQSSSFDAPSQSTHDDQQLNGVQRHTGEQRNGSIAWLPRYQGASIYRWFSLMLIVFGLITAVYYLWLATVLISIAIGILSFLILVLNNQRNIRCRTSRSYRSDNFGANRNDIRQLSDIVIIAFIFVTIIIVLLNTTLHNGNAQRRDMVMFDNVNNPYQDLLINHEDNDVNENATLYNNVDNVVTPVDVYDDGNIQAIVRESIAVEAVDNRTYDTTPLNLLEAEDVIYLNDASADQSNDENESIDSNNNSGYEANEDIPVNSNSDDEDDARSIITHITDEWDSEDSSVDGDIRSVDIDSGYGTNDNDDLSHDNDEINNLDETQNNNQLDQINSVAEQSISSTLSIDSLTDLTLKTEENTNALNGVEREEMVLSSDPTDMGSVKQTTNICSIDDSNKKSASLEVADNRRCNINPFVTSEFQEPMDPNEDGNNEGERSVVSGNIRHDENENDHVIANNHPTGQVSSTVEHLIHDTENNEQSSQIGVIDEGRGLRLVPSASSSYQATQTDQKTDDQTEGNYQGTQLSSRPTTMNSSKQPSPVDCPEESTQENLP